MIFHWKDGVGGRQLLFSSWDSVPVTDYCTSQVVPTESQRQTVSCSGECASTVKCMDVSTVVFHDLSVFRSQSLPRAKWIMTGLSTFSTAQLDQHPALLDIIPVSQQRSSPDRRKVALHPPSSIFTLVADWHSRQPPGGQSKAIQACDTDTC